MRFLQILCFIILFHIQWSINAQNTLISDDPAATTDASAVLNIHSDAKGILIPRLTKIARNGISSPATGLIVYDITVNTFFFYNGTAWEEIHSGNEVLTYLESQEVIRNSDHLSADFIIGEVALPGTGSESGEMLFFDKGKSAFRVGSIVNSDAWSPDSIGLNSIGMGHNAKAKGQFSVALGKGTNASALSSTAMGQYNVGGGNPDSWVATDPLFEIGNGASESSRNNALTILKNGDFVLDSEKLPGPLASSDTLIFYDQSKGAFRGGRLLISNSWSPDSIGNYSFAYGLNAKAKGTLSSAFGAHTYASGQHAMATGLFSSAIGDNSTSMGVFTIANAQSSFAIGQYNVGIGNPNSWVETDPLFEIGNGPALNIRKNALTVLKNGDFLLGSHELPGTTIESDTILFYDQSKSAFRGGKLQSSNSWSPDSIGNYSFAYGFNAKAKGAHSSAFGFNTQARGENTIALGQFSRANGENAVAMGSFAYADAKNSLAIGQYNIGGGNPDSWIETDPLFEIGIGQDLGSKENALTILKNGKVGVKTHTPNGMLHLLHDSGSSDPHLILEENGTDEDYTRLRHTNVTQSQYWTTAGRPDDDNTTLARYNINYSDTGDIVSVYGNGNVRIAHGSLMFGNISSPTFRLQLPNSVNPVEGEAKANAWKTYSDARIKKNVQPSNYGLNEVLALNPVSYLHHSSKFENGELVISEDVYSKNIGFIAQEVYDVIQEVVSKPENESTDLWSMDYEKLTPVLVKAIQEQEEKISALEKKLEQVQKEHARSMESMRETMNLLSKKMEAINP